MVYTIIYLCINSSGYPNNWYEQRYCPTTKPIYVNFSFQTKTYHRECCLIKVHHHIDEIFPKLSIQYNLSKINNISKIVHIHFVLSVPKPTIVTFHFRIQIERGTSTTTVSSELQDIFKGTTLEMSLLRQGCLSMEPFRTSFGIINLKLVP